MNSPARSLKYPVRRFLIQPKTISPLTQFKPQKKDIVLQPPTPTTLVPYPFLILQNLPLSLKSNPFQREKSSTFEKYILPISAVITSLFVAVMVIRKEKDGSENLEGIYGIDMSNSNLDILKDKNFYDYVLQSLTDHQCKLGGYDNVTVRPEFTADFFASYWDRLMKQAEFGNAPSITLENHLHHGMTINGFDSIHRSLFAVCESHIDLRVTTRFVMTGNQLADEQYIHLRTLFMLVLLFVSQWVADQKDECPHVILKEPKSRLVYACFNKLFKDIYYGTDEEFKNYIFDEDKENSCSSPMPSFSSPNCSLNNFDMNCIAVTPYNNKFAKPETEVDESLMEKLSETEEALLKVVNSKTHNEAKLGAECKALKDTVAAKTMEMEKLNEINANIMQEKENLQQHFQSEIKELEGRLHQMELENKKMHEEKETFDEVLSKLRSTLDSFKDRLANTVAEMDRLAKENEDLLNVVRSQGRNAEQLEEEKEALQHNFDEKMSEMNQVNELYAIEIEEKRRLLEEIMKMKQQLEDGNYLVAQKEADLVKAVDEKQSLADTVQKLEMERDSWKAELSKIKAEAVELKNHSFLDGELREQKEALEQTLAEKMAELEKINKLYADEVKEKRDVHEELMKTTRELEDSNKLVGQKNAEMESVVNQMQTLAGDFNKLQEDNDLRVNLLSSAGTEIDRLKAENGELSKVVNEKRKNEERLEEENAALLQAFDEKVLECEKLKELLSNAQEKLRHVLNQLRDLQQVKSNIRAELDEFKTVFENDMASLGNTRSSIKALTDDLADERHRSTSLANELEKLREEMIAKESSASSLRIEGNTASADDELMSEEDERCLDSGIDSNEPSPNITPKDSAVLIHQKPSFIRQCVSPSLMFLLSLLLFFSIYIYSFGVLFPSSFYIKIHHDHLPPQ